MADLFFYGTLRYLPLLRLVLGRDIPEAVAAVLPDHAVLGVKDQPFPLIVAQNGAEAAGLHVPGLSNEDVARLDFYEGGFDYDLRAVTVRTADGEAPAQVYFPEDGRLLGDAPWSLEDWEARWGAMSLRAAQEVMDRRGQFTAGQIAAMLPFFRARAWQRELAATPAPQTLRNPMTIADVEITGTRPGWTGFFNINAFQLRYAKFDGGQSPELVRECFMSFDVALVLPYDPVTDRVLLVEQLRYGPIQRGDPAPWVLEPVAGLVDAGETPEQAARREADEEAGLALRALLPMTRAYASPGYSTEFYHCYLGLSDLDGRGQGQGGLEAENEDIRTHVIPFARAMELIETGEINAAPLVMMILWLATRRDGLRGNLASA